MTFDIVRRIMEDYFNYNVTLAMGVTDIDDKIIIRSKEIMTLVREGFARPDAMSALMACGDVSAARDELRARGAPQKDVDDTDGGSTASAEERAAAADATLLAREMETRFFSDLSRLHIKPPTVVTRVTEHVPSIIKFVQRILSNGFAYVTEDGNRVYFDVIAFSKKHKYAKLMSRCSEGDEDGLLTRNCEGILLQGKRPQKKHPKDFILWRKSDEGEPMWDSPWGKGRPGWHIECSTMASEVLGQCIDLHTGCEDLKFPHHDNELAQSEAHWENHQWVNYFLHHGSLHADAAYLNQLPTPCASRACKSTAQQQAQQNSKKSFTIEDILQVYTSRHVRMLFVLHPYDDALLFTKSSMAAAAQEEEFFCQFFERVRPFTYGEDQKATLLWDDTPERFESALSAAHDCADDAVHRALCSNFDTPTAMQELKKLAEAVLTYVAARERSGGVRVCLLNKALHYIRKIFGVFGLLQGGSDDFVREAPPSTSPSSAAAFSLNKAVCALNPCLRSLPPSASTSADTAFQNPKVSATIDAFFDLKRTVEEQLRCALGGGGAAAAASSQPSNPSSLPPYADGSAAAAGAAGGPAGPAGTAPAGGGALPVGGAGAASALHSDPTVDPRFHSHNEADDDDDSSFQSSDLRALNSGLLNFKRYFKPAPSDDGKQTHAQQQQQQQQPLGSNGTGDNGDDDDGSSNCGSNGGTAGSNGIALAHRTRTKREKVKRKKYVDTLRVLSDVCAVFEEKTLPQLGTVLFSSSGFIITHVFFVRCPYLFCAHTHPHRHCSP